MSKSEIFWDKAAEGYAKSTISDEATYQRKLAETAGFLTATMNVLEFGCGTGSTAIHHAPNVLQIDAVDIAENMLAIAREKAAAAGVTNINFKRGGLQDIAAADACYDAVLGLNVIHLVEDRQATLKEVSRILKPGGVFISSTVCLGQSYLRFIRLLAPLGKVLGLMPDVFVFTEQELATEMSQAGFTIERQWHHGDTAVSVFMVARKN